MDQLQAEWSKGSKPESVKSHCSVKNAVKKLEEAYEADDGRVGNKDGLVDVEAEGAPDPHGSPPGWHVIMSQGPWSYNVCKKKGLIMGESAVPNVFINERNRQMTSHDGNKKSKGTRCDPSLLNLKHIVRLPVKDRNKLIRAIKKLNRKQNATKVPCPSLKCKGGVSLSNGSKSSGSSTDWKNWMILHGTPKEVVADVCDVGKVMGVKVDVDCANMFDVLARGKGEGVKNVRVEEGAKGPKVGEEGAEEGL